MPRRWTATTTRSLSRPPIRARCSTGASRSTRWAATTTRSRYLDAAIQRAPDNAAAHLQRGDALIATGDFAGALASYEQTLVFGTPLAEILDRLALCAAKLCDWTRTADIARQLETHIRDGTAVISPLTLLHYESTPGQQLACARQYMRARFGSASSSRAVPARKHDRLRIAYLAANFNRPALASLVAGLFESHDRITFDIHGISFGPDEDAAEKTRVVRACDAFHDLHAASDRQIAERLRELEIDIAVDLTGHGRGARPGILATRPVPIQVNYLGYPGTMGADFIDYIIADSTVLPPGEGAFYSEKIVRLPGCYLANDAGVIAEATPSRAEAGLPESGFVYASFNGGIISEPIFDAWMTVLTEVQGSVLWLSEVGDATKSNLHQHAQARGIDPARLIFAPRVGHAEHLARLRLADLFLDTLPCGTRAAAADALWEEVPVVTFRGKTFASRVAVSLLHSVGLDLLVASHLREYTALARLLAQRPDMLAGIKKRLAEKRLMSPLFDSDRLRRDLEEAYKMMWARYEAGDPPWSFDVEARTKLAIAPPPRRLPCRRPQTPAAAPPATVPSNRALPRTHLRPRHLSRRQPRRSDGRRSDPRRAQQLHRHDRSILGIAQCQRGLDVEHMGNRGQVGHEGLKLGQIGRHAFEDEVDLARQHPAFADQRLAAYVGLERLEIGLGLAREMHHGERDHLAAQLLLVEERAIAANVAGLLEGAHPAQAGRRRDADPPCQFDIGHAAILLKLAQDMEVDGIEASHGSRLQ